MGNGIVESVYEKGSPLEAAVKAALQDAADCPALSAGFDVRVETLLGWEQPSKPSKPAKYGRAFKIAASIAACVALGGLVFAAAMNGGWLSDSTSDPVVPSVALTTSTTKGENEMNIKQNAVVALSAATLSMASITTVRAESIGSGLAAYLTFDDAVVSNRIPNSTITGVTLSDSGIVSGVKSGELGHSGFGGYLDIDQGWARLEGSQDLEFENGNDFTICVWMRKGAVPTGDPVFVGNGNWNSSVQPGVLLSVQSTYGILNYSLNGTSREKITTSTIPEDEWRFYAVSHTSDGKFHFYMSNTSGDLATVSEKDASDFKLTYDDVASRRPFYLGQDGTGAYSKTFIGKLDEFALWTRGLSSADIGIIYQNGRKGRAFDDLLKPEMAMADAGEGTINLSFSGAWSGTYGLYVASGGADGGADRFAWDHFDFVTNVAPVVSGYAFVLPEAFKNEGRYYRFFLTKAADYQEVEYVENTGTYDSDSSYFTTSIVPTKDTAVYGEVEFEALGNGTWRNIFGCSDSKYFQFGVHNSAAPYDWYTEIRKLESGGNTFMGAVSTGTRYAFDFRIGSMTVWNMAQLSDVTTKALLAANTVFADMSSPITVFRCTRSTGAIYDRPFTGKIYEFSIFTNGMAACDYVPAKNASGVVGFYDLRSCTFHPSESGTAFIGGAVEVGRLTVQTESAKAMTASDPVVAYWIGGANGDVDDPASWHCVNSYGAVIEAVPQTITDVSIVNGAQMFNVPANSLFVCKSIAIGASVALSGDCDWRGVDFTKVAAAGAVDLAGHNLYLAVSENIGSSMTFTDLTGGGELHVEVPSGKTVVNTSMALAGAVTLVKDGSGSLVANRQGQTNSGGVRVDGGTLTTTAYINTRVLGASGSKVEVACGTLRVEDGYTGLEDHDLVLAGGILYMYNSKLVDGRSVIGSLVMTDDSVIRIESTVGNDTYCDSEIASGAVWNLGGHELTVETLNAYTDFFVGRDKEVKPVFRNGTIILPSQAGYWQDYGSDASDHVCYIYGAKYPRQKADSSTYDFVNNIPTEGSNFSNDGTMSIYGTYTPNSDVCSKLRMMNGSAIYLGGRAGAWPMLGGNRPMTFESGATINIDLGERQLSQDEKIVSWTTAPAGITFVNSSASRRQRSWELVVGNDGIYVHRGLAIIIK